MGLGPYAVRTAGPADAAGLLACLAAAFEGVRGDYTEGAFRDTVLTPETVRERLATMTVLLAISAEDGVVGTIAWQRRPDGDGHLRGMAVRPARWGTGLADELLARALGALAAAGCWRVTLETTAPLGRARRFYERHGFRRTGRVVDFFGMPLAEFALELPAPPGAAGRRR